ncbi:sensor histidine kinase [Salisediminibacterium halotolerans]|uniref:histidine kinase n=1 Tax=Salisediminibacterium halotolerans TaxID=517425 RepID=A0A1H9SY00_9BACI|nr:histidine kinase [Salisediminibacterium haloalkalitolerans]SER89890.1 Signal transduction histidine kinase [Salisediminibacterium haloalkalitolerans]
MRLFMIHAGLVLIVSAWIAVSSDVSWENSLFFVGASVVYGLYFSLLFWRKRTLILMTVQLLWALLYGTMMPAEFLPFLLGFLFMAAAIFDPIRPVFTAGCGTIATLAPLWLANPLGWEHTIALTLLVLIAALTISMYTIEARNKDRLASQVLKAERETRQLRRNIDVQEQAVREEERLRIARDIHDSVGHHLTALLMQAGVLRRSVDGKARQHTDIIEKTASEALEQTREAVRQIRDREDPVGVHAVIHLLRRLERESQMRIQWKAEEGFLSAAFTNEQHAAIYRFVQEGMTNAMKYSQSRHVNLHVHIRGGRQAVLTLESGLAKNTAPSSGGSGLAGLRERFEALGGTFRSTQNGEKFTIEGTFPLERVNVQ